MSWASSLDQIWRSPNFPMWLMLAAAVLFGLIVLVTLLRAETSGVNGALTDHHIGGDRYRGCGGHPQRWPGRTERFRTSQIGAAVDRGATGAGLR